MSNEKERIYIHPTSAEFSLNPWPLEPSEYVEYVRADLLTTARKEARAEAFKEAVQIVERLTCPAQFEGNWRNGYSHAQNDAFRAIGAAATTQGR